MSQLDPSLPPEERIRQAVTHGPNIDAAGRFGPATRFARRMMGRAVKYERDFNLQVDLALLDRVHELERKAADDLRTTEARLTSTDDNLRYADKVLREAHLLTRQDVEVLLSRVSTLETSVAELHSRVRDADKRAAVANSIATGAAEGFVEITRNISKAVDESNFAYDEMTALPYVADDAALHYTDEQGRKRLGYHGGAGAVPVYAGFEDIFRGPESLIRERQRVYLEVIRDRGPVVDLGCGRGEMLALLMEAGIEVSGVDLDETMVDRSRALGADVHHGDALEFLVKQADASLGAIFSAQFIEHLPTSMLPELMEIARAKLRPDGVFIAETVNPHSPRALKVFWIDPTHQHPLFPETMLALCRLTGFQNAEIMFPLGTNDLLADLRTCGEYAVVAGARAIDRD
jgi:SAM-dependent methyltransferase